MYCNYCGKVIQDDANLCPYCGKRIATVAGRRKLMRSRTDRKIAGVCAGFAEYFDLDVTVVRVVWLIVAFFGGGGVSGLCHRLDRGARGAGLRGRRCACLPASALSRLVRTRPPGREGGLPGGALKGRSFSYAVATPTFLSSRTGFSR